MLTTEFKKAAEYAPCVFRDYVLALKSESSIYFKIGTWLGDRWEESGTGNKITDEIVYIAPLYEAWLQIRTNTEEE